MKFSNHNYRYTRRSGVLVLTLLILVLVSVVVLGLLTSVTVEKQVSESSFQQRRALSVAMLGFQSGVSQLRDGLGNGASSWDNPYANFAVNPPSFYWSISPGLLTRWSYSQSTALSSIALFSQASGESITNLVDLNRPKSDGSHPIIGGPNPPNVSVQFVNVLQNPSSAPSASNQVIGRYAFWIDDENAKININVADGSRVKYSDDWMKNSLGLGSPTEESLLVLSQGGTNLSPSIASNIVYVARSTSFHSPVEILRVSGTAPDLYTNNIFDLTDFNRSPELNVFGQPRMAIMPVLGMADEYAWNMDINGINLNPLTEIYPTPWQLPNFTVPDPVTAFGTFQDPWPLAFRGEGGANVTGRLIGMEHDFEAGLCSNFPYNPGLLLADYLAGTNEAGTPVVWPQLPGSPTQGFAGKYSNRQLDEIVAQILSIGSKLISSDYPYPVSTDYPTDPSFNPAADFKASSDDFYPHGYHFSVAPYVFPGWLSKEFVIGMGRSPKLTRIGLTLQANPPNGAWGQGGVPLATLYMDPWVEEWIPGAYRGGFPTYFDPSSLGWSLSQVNASDLEQGLDFTYTSTDTNGNLITNYIHAGAAQLPKAAVNPAAPLSFSYNTNNTTLSNSYWANQLMTNNQGIDFNQNWNSYPDPDQGLAAQWHSWAYDTNNNMYDGAAVNPRTSLGLNTMESPYEQEWGVNTQNKGEMRCVTTQYGVADEYPMQLSAGVGANTNLVIGGGLSIHDRIFSATLSDSDPTPLETIRGAGNNPYVFSQDCSIDGFWGAGGATYSWNFTNGMTSGYTPSVTPVLTERDRHIASVIPFAVKIPIPGPGQAPYLTNIVMHTIDPLVNKFPGDWIQDVADSDGGNFPPSAIAFPLTSLGGYQFYSEDSFLQAMKAAGGDPDSFWVPQADCATSIRAGLATQTLIPRSARMPNVGYLQYVRTGIIPDNEKSTPYAQQHGTPWRLFSFGPMNSSQTVHSITYPDWAMLDLFYVPSILNAYGGPYATNTNLAYFGTFGGGTPGLINPNGCVIYTTNVDTPSDVVRTLPIQSTLYGLHVNQTFSGTVDHPEKWPYQDTPTTTVEDFSTSASLATNIADYIHDHGPLRMPGEICNISGVSALAAPENALGTRNDLVRQMVGQLTTQSNVFSVWTVGQVVQKVPGNTLYGEFQPGDQVVGEVRLHFVVERYLDPGLDGVYGNSKSTGTDNFVGSFDDPTDSNHPFEPRFLYRVVRSEEVR